MSFPIRDAENVLWVVRTSLVHISHPQSIDDLLFAVSQCFEALRAQISLEKLEALEHRLDMLSTQLFGKQSLRDAVSSLVDERVTAVASEVMEATARQILTRTHTHISGE